MPGHIFSCPFLRDEKAQLHTLEGVAAATLLLLVIIYAIDATSMTPLTSSSANIHIESELASIGQDILNTLDYADVGYDSKLKNDIMKWDRKEYLWNGTGYVENVNNTYTPKVLNNSLTRILNPSLIRQGIAHRVEIAYLIRDSGTNKVYVSVPEVMINAGVPSDNAIIVSRKIVFQDKDKTGLIGGNPLKDIDPSTPLYNIVDVQLVLWRT